MEARDFSFDEIRTGDTASFERQITDVDVAHFAELSGDTNPIHMDENYAKKTIFKKRLVHGMFLGSLASRLVGMYLPGKHCLYLSQSLVFKKPVFIGDTVTVIGQVLSKSESTRVLSLSVVIKKGEETVVDGEARVQVI